MLLAAAGVMALSSAALAGDGPNQLGNFRASTYGGVFIPQSESWKGSGTLNGLPFNATGKLSSNPGWATGGLVGYTFEDVPGWEWLNIDLEARYIASTFNQFTGTVAIAGVGNFMGPAPLSGQYPTVAGFVNFLATPFGIWQFFDDKMTPFVGIGPGVAGSTAKIQTFSLAPANLPINANYSETDFAFDAVVGADYEIAPQWDLGISYQYRWINVKHLGGGAGIQANTGPASGHSIGLLLEYRFSRAS